MVHWPLTPGLWLILIQTSPLRGCRTVTTLTERAKAPRGPKDLKKQGNKAQLPRIWPPQDREPPGPLPS